MATAGLGVLGAPQQMGLVRPAAGLMGVNGMAGMNGMAAGMAGMAGMNGYAGGAAAGLQFDPTAALDVDKMNAAFAARQQQLLGGANFLLPRS
jgi:hypothetical protein